MFSLLTTPRAGLLALDAGAAIDKRDRLTHTLGAAVATRDLESGSGAVAAKSVAEPANALFWRHDPAKLAPRGAWGSWSFAVPGRFASGSLLPLETADRTDVDFAKLYDRSLTPEVPGPQTFRWLSASYSSRPDAVLPDGTDVVVLSTTGHGARDVVALAAGGPLVAAVARSQFSRHVRNEFAAPSPDAASGPLHRLLRVVPIPLNPTVTLPEHYDKFAPVLTAGGAGDDGLGLGAAFIDRAWQERSAVFGDPRDPARGMGPVVATMLASGGGPLHSGHPLDKHSLGDAATTSAYNRTAGAPGAGSGTLRWNMGALAATAIHYQDRDRSASQYFSLRNYDPTWQDVELVYHADSSHEVAGRVFDGLWRWQVPQTIRPAWPPAQVVVNQRNVVNNNIVINNVRNVVNNWWWNLVVNIKLAPGPGKPIDPARLPTELALKSIYGAGIRRPGTQPYDGRFGGPPVDGGQRDGGSGAFPGAPRPDPVPARPPQDGTATGTAAGAGGATTGAPGSIPGAEGYDPFGGDPFGPAISPRSLPGVFSQAPPTPDELRREDDDARGSGAPWATAPLCWHIQSLAAISDNGQPVATIRAGDYYLSATTAGVAYFGPPESLVDLEANPPSVSLATFGLYDGYQGGSPARLAWGTPAHATGALWGGPYLTMSGSVGTGNLDVRFLDSGGAARVGALKVYGTVAADVGDTTTPGYGFTAEAGLGMYRGGSSVLSFAAGSSARVRVTTTAFSPYGTMDLGALSSPWSSFYLATSWQTGARYDSHSTPTALTADADDYALPAVPVARITSTGGNWDVSGFAAPAGGQRIDLANANASTGYAITLLEESAGSSAANRIVTGCGDVSVFPGESVTLWYDATSARWRIL